MSKKLSCGLIIESQGQFFLGKATGSNRWDIPKGMTEEGETPLQTALRECFEESGMDLSRYEHQIQDLGRHGYLPQKDLHLFHLKLSSPFDVQNCHCTYMVHLTDKPPFPEICDYRWMSWEEVLISVGKGMNALLQTIQKEIKKESSASKDFKF